MEVSKKFPIKFTKVETEKYMEDTQKAVKAFLEYYSQNPVPAPIFNIKYEERTLKYKTEKSDDEL